MRRRFRRGGAATASSVCVAGIEQLTGSAGDALATARSGATERRGAGVGRGCGMAFAGLAGRRGRA